MDFLEKKIPVRKENVEYEVCEIEINDYWLAIAANAIKSFYQQIVLVKMRPDCIWEGD